MGSIAGRWEHLFAQKPLPLLDYLLEEAAKLLAKELKQWPPPIEELEGGASQSFREIANGERLQPPLEAYRQSFLLARWELERQFAAYDDYMRNQRWTERGLSLGHRADLLYLSRWLVEKLLLLREQSQGRVSREQLVNCLERAQRRFESL
jgi:hypothetical protein